MRLSEDSERKPAQEWTASHTKSMKRMPRGTSNSFMSGSKRASTEPNRLRRIYIPKENGKERPISIPSLEDKIVQKAAGELLNAIYEQDFLECSYGFRPGRGPHQALDEVGRVICTKPTSWILELDITAYFGAPG
jgi:RNA-directed DNA polymerase